MKAAQLETSRFTAEDGLRITVQVPDDRARVLMQAILAVEPLKYGDYDRVAFRTAPGMQQFRSLGSGRNTATEAEVEVPCVELSVFVPDDGARVERILRAIYDAHPYEEPVIFVAPCLRTLHIRGTDEDNPNRFWNRPAEDWVPAAHR